MGRYGEKANRFELTMILIRGARQLLTLQGPVVRRGDQLNQLTVIEDGSLLVDGDKILRVGPTRQVENLREARRAHVIEAHGKVVMPGFVDSCTQLVGGGPALNKLDRSSIATHDAAEQEDAIRRGRFRAVRNTSPTALRRSAMRWLKIAVAHGTTSLEVRSSQGLHLATEGKALRAVRSLAGKPLDILPVILAAHPAIAGPDESAVVRKVIEELLPDIERRRLARHCAVDAATEGFDADSTRRIAEAAQGLGFKLKIQTGSREGDSGVRLALEIGATSVTHAPFVRPDEIDALGDSSVVATLLPGVSHQQSARKFAPARDLIDSGVAVALASGFGAAGGPSTNISTVLSLGCSHMGMTAAETISAVTANGAAALGMAERLGSLEPGKQADVTIFDAGDYREIPYHLGINLCVLTMKKGRVIYRAPGYPGWAQPKVAPVKAGIPKRHPGFV
jgi:imidazolonepropionase